MGNQTFEKTTLTIEYALTRGEILRSFLRSIAQSAVLRNKLITYAVVFAVLALVIQAGPSRSVSLADLIRSVLFAIGFLALVPLGVFVRGKTAKRSLTVSSEGISTEIGRLKGRVPWRKVKSVADLGEFILITGTNGNAFFIPRRAFSDPRDRQEFLTNLKERRAQTLTPSR